MAFMGCAAYNVYGKTIHSTMGLKGGPGTSIPNDPTLKDAKAIDKLKNKFQQVKIIIVDEISLVNVKMLHAIDVMLNQTRDGDPAGRSTSRSSGAGRAAARSSPSISTSRDRVRSCFSFHQASAGPDESISQNALQPIHGVHHERLPPCRCAAVAAVRPPPLCLCMLQLR
mmetsp:Transcript_7550/g.31393  ORF Transcript_7550/g.31393 Transcript_7550/m.31393 type:complete len:170 (+) Transcript_7550:138-647(+)